MTLRPARLTPLETLIPEIFELKHLQASVSLWITVYFYCILNSDVISSFHFLPQLFYHYLLITIVKLLYILLYFYYASASFLNTLVFTELVSKCSLNLLINYLNVESVAFVFFLSYYKSLITA